MVKKLFIGLVVVLFVPAHAMAISLTDYEIPESFSRDLYVNGAFNTSGGNQDQASYSAFASGNFNTRYSTIPRVWTLQVDGQYDLFRGATDGDETDDGYNINSIGTLNNYYQDTKVFGYGEADLRFRKPMGISSTDDPYAHFEVGAGYGRVYDATPLAKAIRIVEDLREYGVISRDLTDAGYMKLAHILDKESEYASKYSTAEYRKYWFDDMAKVFKEEGVLVGPELTPLGVVRMMEILVIDGGERFSTRNHGWLVRAGVGYLASDYFGEDEDPTLNAAFMYYLPLSLKLQFSEELRYKTILDSDETHEITNRLGLTYEISNKIDWENSHLIEVTLPSKKGSEDVIKNTLSSGFYYYLTNQMSASAVLSLTHLEDNNSATDNGDVDYRIFLGIQYRLL